MKNLILIIILITFCSCSERKVETITFDASKDTSFVVENSSSYEVFLRYNIAGFVENDAQLTVTYYGSKGTSNENVKLEIPLFAGNVQIINKEWDFYDSKALFTFKHLNNKKGKLTVEASL